MKEANAKHEINKLIELINYHNKIYYEGKTEISDYEFDQLMEKLTYLEKKFPHLKQRDSPSSRVNEHISNKFEVMDHLQPMLSLSNSYSKEELIKYIERIQKILPNEKIDFFCEIKFDGTAISIIYENHKIIRALSRGDGQKGENITDNVLTIKSIPHEIYVVDDKLFEVRGEVFMPRSVFKNLNEKRIHVNEKPFANPRNAAAGSLKLLDSEIVKDRLLDFYPYTLLTYNGRINTQEEAIKSLERLGFNVSKTYKKCETIEGIFEYLDYWEKHRKYLPVDSDGVVIKVNDFLQQKKIGYTSKSPRWAIAYKFKPENLSTLLKNIIFHVGRVGTITPVANLEPLKLAGTIVKRASLYNFNEIERLDIRESDTVFVEKGGDIIPKITGVDYAKRNVHCKKIELPTHCPDCGFTLIAIEGEANIFCPNTKRCPTQIKSSLEHFASKKAMNIKELGPRTISQLFESKMVANAADFYNLKYDDILGKLDGYQEKASLKLITSITNSKNIPFSKVLYGLGIRFVGYTVAEKLANHFKTIENLKKANLQTLTEVDDIGEQIAKSIIAYFSDSTNLEMIERLMKHGIQFRIFDTTEKLKNHFLKGKVAVISGIFDEFSREDLKEYLSRLGMKINSSLSKNTDFLVVGENPGKKKISMAKDLNVRIVKLTGTIQKIENFLK